MKMKQSSEPTQPILTLMAMDSETVTELAMELVSPVQIPHLLTLLYQSIPTVMRILMRTQTEKAASSQILTMTMMDSLTRSNSNVNPILSMPQRYLKTLMVMAYVMRRMMMMTATVFSIF